MYDILGREQRQGEQEAAGGKESNSLRLHNDVHKVSATSCVWCFDIRGGGGAVSNGGDGDDRCILCLIVEVLP